MLAEHFHSPKPLVIFDKDDGTKVTDLDLLISDFVANACWQYGKALLSEERGSLATYGQDDIFVLDPIDGTHDLIEAKERRRGVSLAGVSLALWQQSSVLGVVGFPLLGSPPVTYMAYRGGGAWRESDGQLNPVYVDATPTRGIVFVTTAQTEGARRLIQTLRKTGFTPFRAEGAVFKACAVVDPSLSSMYRRFDFVLPRAPIVGFVSRGVHLHDIAAVACIVREAGGVTTEPVNAEDKQVWAAANNQEVHDLLFEAARSA
jgi:fructose-1,6-bisphosphatase/inositol monophosphatase family enzyme